MRTVTRTLYTYEELSPKAQERARDGYRSIDTDWGWGEEYRHSLEAGLRLFGATSRDWQVDASGGWITLRELPEDPNEEQLRYLRHGAEPEPMEGARLARWIEREYGDTLARGCPFTGMCADEGFLDPVRAFLRAPKRGTTWPDLVRACAESWAQAVSADIAFQASDEAVAETIVANGYEFTAEGSRA